MANPIPSISQSDSAAQPPKRAGLLVLAFHYRPEPNFITTDVAESMTSRFDVTVIAPHPNYPLGRFYPGTKFWRIQRSVENGVRVWRIPYFPDHSLSSLRRTASYLSFVLMAATVAPFVAGRPGTVWVYHGPFMTVLAGLWFKLVYGSRLVVTTADLWPESLIASGLGTPSFVVRILLGYRRFVNRLADEHICSTRGTVDTFRREGIAERRLSYVPVWVDGVGQAGTHPGPGGRSEIVYAGNLGPAQPLDVVVRAAAILQREGVDVHFAFYGSGTREAELRALAESEGASNVTFHGRVSPEKAFAVSSAALAQIVALQPSPAFDMTVPSKLFSAFAAASPLIFSLAGEAALLARESGAALEFDARNPDSLAAAIKKILAMTAQERTEMRQRLQSYYESNFARELLLERYREVLGRTASPATAASR